MGTLPMRLTLTCALLLLGRTASAADDASAQARAHYNQAQGHFAVGEFKLAADEYQAAYKLKQDPALLFNAAQSRRLAGENQQALILYKNYLQFHPKARNIAEVKEQITKLEEAIAAADKAKSSPPTTTVEPGAEPREPAPQQPSPQQQVVVAQQPDRPADKPVPIYKKWWLWTAVGVVVVAAVVIPVAVVTSQPANWSNVSNISNAVEVRW
jgi:tetratricopeptide (TPR) repeat protein